jgi:hypothetical protein
MHAKVGHCDRSEAASIANWGSLIGEFWRFGTRPIDFFSNYDILDKECNIPLGLRAASNDYWFPLRNELLTAKPGCSPQLGFFVD